MEPQLLPQAAPNQQYDPFSWIDSILEPVVGSDAVKKSHTSIDVQLKNKSIANELKQDDGLIALQPRKKRKVEHQTDSLDRYGIFSEKLKQEETNSVQKKQKIQESLDLRECVDSCSHVLEHWLRQGGRSCLQCAQRIIAFVFELSREGDPVGVSFKQGVVDAIEGLDDGVIKRRFWQRVPCAEDEVWLLPEEHFKALEARLGDRWHVLSWMPCELFMLMVRDRCPQKCICPDDEFGLKALFQENDKFSPEWIFLPPPMCARAKDVLVDLELKFPAIRQFKEAYTNLEDLNAFKQEQKKCLEEWGCSDYDGDDESG